MLLNFLLFYTIISYVYIKQRLRPLGVKILGMATREIARNVM